MSSDDDVYERRAKMIKLEHEVQELQTQLQIAQVELAERDATIARMTAGTAAAVAPNSPSGSATKSPSDTSVTTPKRARSVTTPTTASSSSSARIWLECLKAEKDAVKNAGGQWHAASQRWYVLDDTDLSAFGRWLSRERVYLCCPFKDKEDAKSLGAQWDGATGQWYIYADMDQTAFVKWMPLSEEVKVAIDAKRQKALALKWHKRVEWQRANALHGVVEPDALAFSHAAADAALE